MTLEQIIAIGIAAIIGGLIGFFISRAIAAAKSGKQRADIELQQTQIAELTAQKQNLESRLHESDGQINRQNTDLALLKHQTQSLTQERDQYQQQTQTKQQKLDTLQQQIAESNEQIATSKAQQDALLENLNEAKQKNQQLEQQLQQQQAKTESVEQQRHVVSEQLAALKTSLDEKKQHFEQQKQHLDEQKAIMKQEFQVLANEILDSKGKAFKEQNKVSMDALLNPFKEQLEGFRKRVDEVHTHQTESNANLKTELTKLHELNQRITDEASNLTKALKGDKKKQGNWGELQVEMILDQSGLRKGIEYEREANRKDEDNKNWRPDFIVNLPEGKHVIIDSKVSLIDYNDFVATELDSQRETCLLRHVQAVRKHINDLHLRDYSQLQGVNSPDFVFMFMPIEPAFIAAFEKDPGLFNNAFEKHIVVVTPSTLLATLRTIANIWSIERQNQNAKNLAEQGAKVYDKLRVFVEKMDKLGNQLVTARNTYDDAYNTLTGSRSLTSTVQKFADLGVRVKKELPATVVESAQLDDEAVNQLELQTQDKSIN